MHAYSNPLGKRLVKKMLAKIIVIIWPLICVKAVFITFLVAEKYPLIAAPIEIKGNATEIMYNGNFVILFLKHILTIKFEVSRIIIEEIIPKQKLSIKHSVIAFIEPFVFDFAISSETILVAVKFIPEVASVIKNEYTDIINVKRPTPSAPILFDINTLKNIDIDCIIIDENVSIKIFIINNFAFLKINIT